MIRISGVFLGFLGVLLAGQAGLAQAETIKNESEAGIVITGGNTEVSTLSLKQGTTWLAGPNAYSLNARYLRSSNSGIEQALQWGAGVKAAHTFSSSLGAFVGQLIESNIYQGIQQRYSTDAGGKAVLHQVEKDWSWWIEGGYRFTRENYLDGFQNLNFLRVYSEFEHYFAETVSAKLWVEMLPNLTRWKAYQFNSNLSLNTSLNSVFSLKNSFELRYNNEPPAVAKSLSDRIFTTSLVAKF